MSVKLAVASFTTESSFLHATSAARDSEFVIVDTYTPYAVHGIEKAMGSKGTRLGIFCFVLGVTGLLTALGFQLWVTSYDWPMNIGGKTHSAIPALIPVTFEIIILFAAVGSVFGFFIRSRLWPGQEPEVLYDRVTDDRFVLVIRDNAGDVSGALKFLEGQGAVEITEREVPQ